MRATIAASECTTSIHYTPTIPTTCEVIPRKTINFTTPEQNFLDFTGR